MACQHRGCNCKESGTKRGGKEFCSNRCADIETTGKHDKSCPCGHPGCAAAKGWSDGERAEVASWRQSTRLVSGEMVWDAARRRDPAVTSANLFWWFNMYGTADFSVTPRPAYPADGRKIPDCSSHPAQL